MGIFKGLVKRITKNTSDAMLNHQQPEQPAQNTGGLAVQAIQPSNAGESSLGTTSMSGIVNPAANVAAFGNRTNGSGIMQNNQFMQGMNGGLASMGLNQNQMNQPQNQYQVIGGVQII